MLSSNDTNKLLQKILATYRGEKKSLQILLSSTQAGPGRKVKQEQEEIYRNHVQAFIPGSVCTYDFTSNAVVELPKTNVTNNMTMREVPRRA